MLCVTSQSNLERRVPAAAGAVGSRGVCCVVSDVLCVMMLQSYLERRVSAAAGAVGSRGQGAQHPISLQPRDGRHAGQQGGETGGMQGSKEVRTC